MTTAWLHQLPYSNSDEDSNEDLWSKKPTSFFLEGKNLKPPHPPNSPTWSRWRVTAGVRLPFAPSCDINEVAKTVTNRSPLNCRIWIRLDAVFWRNISFKPYFLSAWAPLPVEPKTGLSDWQTEPFSGRSSLYSLILLKYDSSARS